MNLIARALSIVVMLQAAAQFGRFHADNGVVLRIKVGGSVEYRDGDAVALKTRSAPGQSFFHQEAEKFF